MLLNLAGNAIKFTATGGVALIVEPGIWPNEISFLVRDTGIGIAPEAQERIFREFEQADERIARSYGGTGLGLSISERIVKRMGGRITLESTLGDGSTFEVSAAAGGQSDDGGQPAFAVPDLDGQSIMLVAPQSIEASLMARRLQRWGGQTCMVSDIAVARALLPERTWHAVLLDHALGRRGGRVAGRGGARLTPRSASSCSRRRRGTNCNPLHRLGLHRLSGQAVARGLARSPPDDGAGNCRAEPCRATPWSRLPGEPETPPAATARGLSVLVAEDNEINALLMRSLLTRLGHQAVIATNGEEALESWLAAKSAGTPYDLVLMDIQMPQLDGIETTKRIRDREAARPAADPDPRVDREYAGGGSLCLLRSRHGRLSDQAARSRQARRCACGLAAARHLAA